MFYLVKPFVPRRVQLFIQRKNAKMRLSRYSHIWPIDSRASRNPDGWKGWRENKQFALVLTHDVETSSGQERCLDMMELERRLGCRSAFFLVAEDYPVSDEIRARLAQSGFEVGVHGLRHDPSLYRSRRDFRSQAKRINAYLARWAAAGFRSPIMRHDLEWIHGLDIRYDASAFDTDPFEPRPDGMRTIFPFWIHNTDKGRGYVEIPYTLRADLNTPHEILAKGCALEIPARVVTGGI